VVFFLAKAPPRVQRWLIIVAHFAILVMLAAFIWYSVPIIELSSGETTLSTGWNGSIYFYALPIGCVVMAYYQIQALLRLFRSDGYQAVSGDAP